MLSFLNQLTDILKLVFLKCQKWLQLFLFIFDLILKHLYLNVVTLNLLELLEQLEYNLIVWVLNMIKSQLLFINIMSVLMVQIYFWNELEGLIDFWRIWNWFCGLDFVANEIAIYDSIDPKRSVLFVLIDFGPEIQPEILIGISGVVLDVEDCLFRKSEKYQKRARC